MEINVVFMGSPEFSLPVLQQLAEKYRIAGVVTQPDRPSGRGRKLASPPVKSLAVSLGIDVIQPERLRNPEAFAQLTNWKPDLIVVAAYAQILRQNVLELPRFGCINVHASLLPHWRGASPIQYALLYGETYTGMTIMKMDAGLDTGLILSQRQIHILPDDTAGILSKRLSAEGSALLMDTLPAYLEGKIIPHPQDNDQITYAPMIKKEEGLLDFNQSAESLKNRIRAFNPWPSAYISWEDSILKIHRAHTDNLPNSHPGHRSIIKGFPAIATAQGWLVLDEVQPAGKKPMAGDVFLRGARHWEGNR